MSDPSRESGASDVVRGGASVRFATAEEAAPARPASTPTLSDGKAGLFQARVIEFGETRRETIVSVQPQVREEIVVGRSVERHIEQVDETVRRTEAKVEDLPPRARERDSGTP